MTCREQAVTIYELCVASAKTNNTLSYGDVISALGYGKGVRGHAIRYGLELVLIACAHLGLPILSSLVVNESSGSPSPEPPGKSWEEEILNSFRQEKWPHVDEIDWEYVWNNRNELSDRYGTSGYWTNKK